MSNSVLIVMGSKSDRDVMEEAVKILDSLGIPNKMRIASAHRTPEVVGEIAKGARKDGVAVIIAGAGYAAHLAGVVASMTTIPVIGVPIASSSLAGIDALLSTVQMPPGVPVATVGIGAAGAKNAALLAAEILAVSDDKIAKKLEEYRNEMREKVIKADKELG
ncbi:MAG: 5-(carboxyamino)imidazole ribonucleotide mutase [Deltaproteobacteria bacterium]|uniref:N5-carboxyaminoimidazole ribonucleotide mutase n=1 Tax=Candidatus Zymogenus saltonus TaxID=2844893 RepID=A0A9D8KCR8_9DELT|nr:5-(carboxyamino)imidazole ribonucleotide mutase [Candidatus Zymogenus saltonus]